jgi:hypothetical protein
VDNRDENQSMMVQHKNILYLHHKILQIDSINIINNDYYDYENVIFLKKKKGENER